MGADGPALTLDAVRAHYAKRQSAAQSRVDALTRRADWIARARLATFLATLALAGC